MRIIGVNGINTHGERNVDLMLELLGNLGYQTEDVYLPKRSFISARWGAARDARIIADMSQDGDVVVAHSFGCLRAAVAMTTRKFKAAFLFRPAMDRNYAFPEGPDIHCFHSDQDMAILAGQFLLLHPFGAAGRVGFTDRRVINVQSFGGHSADFTDRLTLNVRYVDKCLRQF